MLKKLFGAKKHISKADAKKLKNLVPFKLRERRKIMWSDNWQIFSLGALLGFALGLLYGA